MTTNILNSLNSEQLEAVTTLDKSLLVLSGAGTGKTKVLTTKIAHIIEHGYALPYQILAVTFTNRAAREMRVRLNDISYGSQDVWLGTFHSICAKILRINIEAIGISRDFSIIDADDQLKIVKQILKELNIDKKKAKGCLLKISRWKDKAITTDDNSIDDSSLEGKVYKIYQQRLKTYDSLDFGDLLLYTIQLFKENSDILNKYREKFRYILVDEYQDTNIAQYILLRMLTPDGKGLCCVGDDDQAIYSWRGAEVENILRFEKDFKNTKIVRLEKNYRSKGHILGAASSLISHNENRLGKTIWTDGDIGEKITLFEAYNGFEEAFFVANTIENLQSKNINLKNIAVLVRAGFQTREFEDRFIAFGLPYRVIGGLKFYDRQEIKDIIAYIRLIYQSNDSLAFERIINVPKRGIGASTISQFHQHAREHNCSLYQAALYMMNENLIRKGIKSELSNFFTLINNLKNKKDMPPAHIAKIIMEETGYLSQLKTEKTLESEGRIENLKELLLAMEEYQSIDTFMEHVSLIMEAPQKHDTQDLITIMTLHSAKGLEFEAIFLAGWEENVFPHSLSLQEGNLEEERRLAYVGITRAKQNACISYARNRRIHNQWQINEPSRFIKEISTEHMKKIHKRF